MEITQVGQTLPDVTLRLTPEEASCLRRLFGDLTHGEIMDSLGMNDAGVNEIFALTTAVYGKLYDLHY